VHTSHLTSGIATLALALLLAAWFFSDLLLLMPAATLLLFLLARYILFFQVLRTVGDHLTFHRETDKVITRQGGVVTVSTTCTGTVPGRAHVLVQDLLPPGAVQKSGETRGVLTGSLTLRYEIALMATGAISFRGCDLELSDAFFRTTLRCRTPPFREPVIHVQPFSIFALTGAAGLHGEVEHNRHVLIPGYGIRAFRDYVTGDDPRHIDWKLSAKHGRIFVRQYTGLSGSVPLIVLDMPERDAPPGAADTLKGAVSAIAEQTTVRSGGGHLLAISGANVIRSLSFSRQMRSVRELLNTLTTGERLVSLYRKPDPATLRSRSRRAGALDEPDVRGRRFLSGLSDVYLSFSSAMKPSTFEVQVSRVFGSVPAADVYLFSAFTGDQSHIRMIILEARRRGMPVHARIPAASATPALLRGIARSDPASIEVI
jgi:uncharacterized protein (DUF58 family)